jgi:hypothetical protein
MFSLSEKSFTSSGKLFTFSEKPFTLLRESFTFSERVLTFYSGLRLSEIGGTPSLTVGFLPPVSVTGRNPTVREGALNCKRL